MVSALLIERSGGVSPCLETLIGSLCPEINILRKADPLAAQHMIYDNALIYLSHTITFFQGIDISYHKLFNVNILHYYFLDGGEDSFDKLE